MDRAVNYAKIRNKMSDRKNSCQPTNLEIFGALIHKAENVNCDVILCDNCPVYMPKSWSDIEESLDVFDVYLVLEESEDE